MPRKKSKAPQYGEPTNSVTVRIPAKLHDQIKVRAKQDRTTKSRKIVALLADAIGPAEQPQEDVFG